MVLLMNGVHQSKLKTLDLASLEIAQPHDMTEKKDEKKEDISYMVGCANVCI
jgi:hypothetical protein